MQHQRSCRCVTPLSLLLLVCLARGCTTLHDGYLSHVPAGTTQVDTSSNEVSATPVHHNSAVAINAEKPSAPCTALPRENTPLEGAAALLSMTLIFGYALRYHNIRHHDIHACTGRHRGRACPDHPLHARSQLPCPSCRAVWAVPYITLWFLYALLVQRSPWAVLIVAVLLADGLLLPAGRVRNTFCAPYMQSAQASCSPGHICNTPGGNAAAPHTSQTQHLPLHAKPHLSCFVALWANLHIVACL